MTNNLITLTITNDDHIALRAFGKALEEMALAHGAEPRKTVGELAYKLNIDTTEATAALERLNAATGELMQAAPRMMQELRCEGDELQGKRKEPEVDTTAQQVEALATHVMTEQKLVGEPVPVGGGYSQAYIATIEEIANAVDKTGTPWDERIHSASKALNADGTWRLRRKPKDMADMEWSDYVTMIKADLQYPVECGGEEPTEQDALDAIEKATNDLNNGVPIAEAVAPLTVFTEPPVTPLGDDFHTDAGVVTEQNVAGIPPIPVPPPVVVPPVLREVSTETLSKALAVPYGEPEQAWDFPKLMKFLTERHGKIDVPTVNQLLEVDGLAALTDLNAHPDKIGSFVARVKAHLGE